MQSSSAVQIPAKSQFPRLAFLGQATLTAQVIDSKARVKKPTKPPPLALRSSHQNSNDPA
jgi:hypothetical protein